MPEPAPNLDQDVLQSRCDAARARSCASAVSTQGRRTIAANDVRTRRAHLSPVISEEKAKDTVVDEIKAEARTVLPRKVMKEFDEFLRSLQPDQRTLPLKGR